MTRVKRSVHSKKKRREVLTQAKGTYGQKRISYRKAREQQLKSLSYQYRDRKARKGEFRRLWSQRINAGARQNGLTYNTLIHGLKLAAVDLDRKVLADLAVAEPETFAAVCDVAREALASEPAQAEVNSA
ncbi:MAG: 50S ribosomal protein L20 [Acidimicrobiia bacterium]|nr:50S ribosomal protein L20 [Acidimicrobiia bacterium]